MRKQLTGRKGLANFLRAGSKSANKSNSVFGELGRRLTRLNLMGFVSKKPEF